MSQDVIKINDNPANENENGGKSCFELDRKDTVFKIILCIASVLMVFFGVWGGFRSGFTVTALILFSSMTVYLANSKTKIRPFALV